MRANMTSECWGKVATNVLQDRNEEAGDNVQVLLTALKECSRTRDLARGKQVHAEAVKCGQDCNIYVSNALINMYAKCASIEDAFQIFEGLGYATVVSWTALIMGYAGNGQGYTALDLFTKMRTEGPPPNSVTFVAALKSCTSLAVNEDSKSAESRDRGTQLQNIALENGCNSNTYVQNSLIDLYAKCGSMVYARDVFDHMKERTVVSWTTLILGYANNGQGHTAVDIFSTMRSEGPALNSETYVAVLKACTCLAVKETIRWEECRNRGKEIHNIAMENGCHSNAYVQNSLLDIYSKCGSMVDAREVFDHIKHPDVISWNVMILGYADNGQGQTAVDMFTRMKIEGPTPNSVSLVAALRACTSLALEGASRWVECRDRGKDIHDFSLVNGCNSDRYVQNSLIDMYGKCGSMADAREVFDSMIYPDVVSWNVLILGYADNGQGHTAMDMFTRMKAEGPAPDSVTLVAALKACTSLAVNRGVSGRTEYRAMGKVLQNIAVENGCSSDVYVQSTLVDMYAKCESMVDAGEVFGCMKHPTVVSWTALILGYADNGECYKALDLFKKMRSEGPAPNPVTLVAALKACTSIAVLERASKWAECRDMGINIHSIAVETGCYSDAYVQNSLIDMYAKCGSMVDARKVFDGMIRPTVVSWNVLILGYADSGECDSALDMFTKMRAKGPLPDSVTLVATLKACTYLAQEGGAREWAKCSDMGKEIHNFALENGCNDTYVQNSLIDMYAKCRSMIDARKVFDGMEHPDFVSWNMLILGYVDNGQGHPALDVFSRMRTKGLAPNSATFGAALKACGLVGALELGKAIHSEIDSGNELDIALVTCLVDFYGKCGSLVEAQSVFDLHGEKRDMITWNALLAGYSNCGDNEAVFALFEGMLDAGFRPDSITFLCILTCCSHAGLVVKGKECFDAMSIKYGLTPTVKHFTCMIDLFGRVNKVDDAMALLERMPYSPDDVTWMTVLSACRKWKNLEIGRLAYQSLNDLSVKYASAHVSQVNASA